MTDPAIYRRWRHGTVAHGVLTPGPLHQSFAPGVLGRARHWVLDEAVTYGSEHKTTLEDALAAAIQHGKLRPMMGFGKDET